MEAFGKVCSQLTKQAIQRSLNQGALGGAVTRSNHRGASPALCDRTEIDYEELSYVLTFGDEIALVDVRSPNELQHYGSIPGAVNIPLGDVKTALQLPDHEFRDAFRLPKPAKNEPNLIFFARGPNASRAAVEIAHKLGYKKSRQYTGGWEDYCQKTGIPLKKNNWPASIVRQKTPFMGRASFDVYNTSSLH